MEYLMILTVWCIVWGCLGGWISDEKGRSSGEGVVLGVRFGPLGVLITALMPNVTKADRQCWYHRPPLLHRS